MSGFFDQFTAKNFRKYFDRESNVRNWLSEMGDFAQEWQRYGRKPCPGT